MGLTSLGKWSHALFWSQVVNLGLFVGISMCTKQSEREQVQALKFVDQFSPRRSLGDLTMDQTEEVLQRLIGRREGAAFVEGFLTRNQLQRENLKRADIEALRSEAKRIVSSSLGSAIASMAFEENAYVEERDALLDSISHMTRVLRLSRSELAETNRELELLKELRESIIESLPQGVMTLDEAFQFQYWNRAMQALTGLDSTQVLHSNVLEILPQMERLVQAGHLEEGPFDFKIDFDRGVRI